VTLEYSEGPSGHKASGGQIEQARFVEGVNKNTPRFENANNFFDHLFVPSLYILRKINFPNHYSRTST